MQKIIFIIQTKNKRPSVRPQLSQPAIRHLCHVLFQSKWKFRRHCTFHTATGLNANVQEEPLSAAAFLSPLSRKRKRNKKKRGGTHLLRKSQPARQPLTKPWHCPGEKAQGNRAKAAGRPGEMKGSVWLILPVFIAHGPLSQRPAAGGCGSWTGAVLRNTNGAGRGRGEEGEPRGGAAPGQAEGWSSPLLLPGWGVRR